MQEKNQELEPNAPDWSKEPASDFLLAAKLAEKLDEPVQPNEYTTKVKNLIERGLNVEETRTEREVEREVETEVSDPEQEPSMPQHPAPAPGVPAPDTSPPEQGPDEGDGGNGGEGDGES